MVSILLQKPYNGLANEINETIRCFQILIGDHYTFRIKLECLLLDHQRALRHQNHYVGTEASGTRFHTHTLCLSELLPPQNHE